MSSYECVVDGASRGQGKVQGVNGEASAAVLLFEDSKFVGQYARCLGKRTNNEAEYEAVLLALMMCWAAKYDNPVIYSDSALVVNQVKGTWACTQSNLQPLLLSIKEIGEVFSFTLKQVPRHKVGQADTLANAILDMLQDYQKDTTNE